MAGNVYQNVLSLVKNSEVLHWSQSESITKTRYVHEKSNQMLLRVDEGESNIDSFELNIFLKTYFLG